MVVVCISVIKIPTIAFKNSQKRMIKEEEDEDDDNDNDVDNVDGDDDNADKANDFIRVYPPVSICLSCLRTKDRRDNYCYDDVT
jgi:hypothetical protein